MEDGLVHQEFLRGFHILVEGLDIPAAGLGVGRFAGQKVQGIGGLEALEVGIDLLEGLEGMVGILDPLGTILQFMDVEIRRGTDEREAQGNDREDELDLGVEVPFHAGHHAKGGGWEGILTPAF